MSDQSPTPFSEPGPEHVSLPAAAQLGPATYGEPTIPVAAPTRKRRTWPIAAGTGVLGLVAGLLIGGGTSDSDVPDPVAAPATTSTAPSATPEPEATTPVSTAPEATTPEPAETTTRAAVPEEGDGTRAHPFAIGQKVSNDEWEVVLGTPKESWKAIYAENSFNDPAPDGMEYYIVPVTATYVGSETGVAWAELTVRFVGDDGVTYSDYCGVLPDSLSDVGELYEGGKAEGNVCVSVPAGAKGLWTLTAGWSDPVFFAAKK